MRFVGIFYATLLLVGICHAEQHAFTVKDDIEMYRMLRQPVFSPDGKYFFQITQRGLLERNVPEYTFWVWSTDEVARFTRSPIGRKPPKPIPLARVAQYKDGPMNSPRAEWLDNSSGIVFAALNKSGRFQLFHTDLKTRHTEALTPDDQNVTGYDARHGRYVYTITSPEIVRRGTAELQSNTADITGKGLFDLLFPSFKDPRSLQFFYPYSEIWILVNGKHRRIEEPKTRKPVCLYVTATAYSAESPFKLSPDGRKLVVMRPVENVPQNWAEYKAPTGYEGYRSLYAFGVRQEIDPFAKFREAGAIFSYELIDLASGTVEPLINAPTGRLFDWNADLASARWSSDGTKVLLTNTFLPLDVSDERLRLDRSMHPCVTVLELKTREPTCVLPIIAGSDKQRFGISNVRFDARENRRVIINFSSWRHLPTGRTSAEYRQNEDGKWAEERDSQDPAILRIPFELTIKQDLDEPPVLSVSDKLSSHTRPLWNPNPQLASIEWGKTTLITWKDATGWEYKADLIKPPHYTLGERYPLVIQTHGIITNAFITSGATETGFAARELAAAGIVVVQMGWNTKNFGRPEEGSDQVSGFTALIDLLDKEGLIDPDKVGLIGWSRSVYHTYAALTVGRPKFAAASVIEGVNMGYWQYLGSIAEGDQQTNSLAAEYGRVIGAPPFGPGLQSWIERSPMFNLDKVTTPLLMLETGLDSLLADWEPYASLYSLNRPVDLVLVKSGQHVESNPMQRLATQGGNVDWFRFWLQGFKDSDPAKEEQYRRWEKLRIQSAHAAKASLF